MATMTKTKSGYSVFSSVFIQIKSNEKAKLFLNLNLNRTESSEKPNLNYKNQYQIKYQNCIKIPKKIFKKLKM